MGFNSGFKGLKTAVPVYVMKIYAEVEVQLLSFLISALDEVNKLQAPATLYPEKTAPPLTLKMKLGRSQGRSGRFER